MHITRLITDEKDPVKITTAINQMAQTVEDLGAVLTNSRNAQTSNYTVLNTDDGDTIALGGNVFFTLTFNAASGYNADFMVIVLNEDSYSGPSSGRGKTIALSGGTNFILWPGQSVIILNQNNVWQVFG